MAKRWYKWGTWLAGIWLILIILGALFANFLANDHPILAQTSQGELVSILWTNDQQWTNLDLDWQLNPMIGYDAATLDLKNANYQPPLTIGTDDHRHWLGTDQIGRDVLAGLIYGCRFSFITALIATLLSIMIGLPLGLISGFYGDHGLQLNQPMTFAGVIVGGLILYQVIYASAISLTLHAVLFFATLAFLYGVNRISQHSQSWTFPMDTILTRVVELMIGLPGLVVLLAVSAAIESHGLLTLAIIIGVLRWVRIAQVSRNESARLTDETYIQSARTLGYSDTRIIFRHLFPNMIEPLMVIAIFSVASFILLESSLSFLGIGVALENQTWGSMLSEARRFIKAWWLAIFPGMAIFLTILSIYIIGENVKRQDA